MQEYRRNDRIPVSGFIQVTDMMAEEPMGRVGNLSAEGMMLIAHRPILEDALFQLQFRLPDRSAEIHVGVHALWCERSNAPGTWWAGFRIIDISEADQQALDAWLYNEHRSAAQRKPSP